MAEQLIDWSDISGIIIDVRRNARSSHGITRNSNHTGRSSAKRPRLDAHIDVTIGPEHFPEIDKANDGIEDPARFFIDPQHGKVSDRIDSYTITCFDILLDLYRCNHYPGKIWRQYHVLS